MWALVLLPLLVGELTGWMQEESNFGLRHCSDIWIEADKESGSLLRINKHKPSLIVICPMHGRVVNVHDYGGVEIVQVAFSARPRFRYRVGMPNGADHRSFKGPICSRIENATHAGTRTECVEPNLCGKPFVCVEQVGFAVVEMSSDKIEKNDCRSGSNVSYFKLQCDACRFAVAVKITRDVDGFQLQSTAFG